MPKKRDKEAKHHQTLTGEGASLAEHARLARLGRYRDLSDDAFRVLAAIGSAARAKKDCSHINHPRAREEYDRLAVLAGKFLVECLERPIDGTAILRAVAEALDVAKRHEFTLDEFPNLAFPNEEIQDIFNDENGTKAVKKQTLIEMAEQRGLEVPRLPDSKPVDPVRLRLAMGVYFKLHIQGPPDHRFTVRELRELFRGQGPIPAERTIRRAAHELGIPLVGPGAPKGTKQKRQVR